jgi:hypothetical protein
VAILPDGLDFTEIEKQKLRRTRLKCATALLKSITQAHTDHSDDMLNACVALVREEMECGLKEAQRK